MSSPRYDVLGFGLAANDHQVPIFVRDAGVAGAGVGAYSTSYVNALPDGRKVIAYLLHKSERVQVVKKHFAFALASIDENLVVHYAAAVGVAGFGDIANLVALDPG